MSQITTRLGKGSPLTNAEVDQNFTNLNADKYEAGDNISVGSVDASWRIDAQQGVVAWEGTTLFHEGNITDGVADGNPPYSSLPGGFSFSDVASGDGYPSFGTVMTVNRAENRCFQLEVHPTEGTLWSRGRHNANPAADEYWTPWKRALSDADTQSSPTDTTAGALLEVGAFGLGADEPPLVPDLDAFQTLRPGFYGTGAGTSNIPPEFPHRNGKAFVTRSIGGNGVSILWQANYPEGSAETWERSWTPGGGFGPWLRHWNSGNIFGTVSQSGGAPTGALIERGSNANGEYVRFADGTQMCWLTCVVDLSDGSPSFTLPATLASTASARVFLAIDGEWGGWSDSNDRHKAQGHAYSRVESSSSIEIIPSGFAANYGGAEGAFSVLVFGRWF